MLAEEVSQKEKLTSPTEFRACVGTEFSVQLYSINLRDNI